MRTVRRVRDRVRLHSEEQEIVLHEEVPVVEMRVRPRERVRIVKETRRGEAPVVEEVRAERIEAVCEPEP